MCSRGACIDSTETHQEVKARDGVGLPMPSMPAISMANGGMGTGMMAMCDDACEGIGIGMTGASFAKRMRKTDMSQGSCGVP
jgi:hypothetical protein